MNTIFRVNDWEVVEEESRFVITNSSHPEWINYYMKDTDRYRYRNKRVPKAVDRAIQRALGRIDTPAQNIERTFGIEIECLHNSNYNIRQDVVDALHRKGIGCEYLGYTHRVTSSWKIVTDSSISGGTGLEVVSPILKGQEGINQVKEVMKTLSELGCRVNRSTGMHVHIGARDLNDNQLHTCFEFYKKNEGNFDQLVAYSRRSNNNHFCRTLRDLPEGRFPSTRYTKLNYESYLKYGTIEFRQHQGSLNGDKAEHWIKLVMAVVNYARSSRGARQFYSVEDMVKGLGLESEVGWYLERVEELAS